MSVAGRELRAQLSEWLRSHKAIYGDAHIRPKHHWAFDVCDQLEADPMVIDAFTLERLHLRIRCQADRCCTLHNYEDTVLAGVTNVQSARAEVAADAIALVGKVERFPGMPSVSVSDAACCNGSAFKVGSYVCRGGHSVGHLVACACEAGLLFLIVDEMIDDGKVTESCVRCFEGGSRVVWRAAEVTPALAWKRHPDGRVLVIVA